MAVRTARHGDLQIAYEVEGPNDGTPLLLVMGLGLQMLFWPPGFRQMLVDRGFRVARFDNRDVGLSTHLSWLGAPHVIDIFRVIGSPGYARDEDWLREVAAESFDRAHDPDGVRRQLAAIVCSDDRRPMLRRLRIPALVVHGDSDVLVRPAGGRATAAAIPGAQFVLFPGMGHDLPAALWTPMADGITSLASRWQAAA
jgi:pimeloyl-ACP methyl ester carboxylesterase